MKTRKISQLGGRRGRGKSKGGPKKGGPQKGGPQKGGPKKGGPQKGGPQKGGPQKGGPQKGGPQKGGPQKGGPGGKKDGPDAQKRKDDQRKADQKRKDQDAAAKRKRNDADAAARRKAEGPGRTPPDLSALAGLAGKNKGSGSNNRGGPDFGDNRGDGNEDEREGRNRNENGNGNGNGSGNANGNGDPDNEDPNSINTNGNGIPNSENDDDDGNGIPNSENDDDDGNGIPNSQEKGFGKGKGKGVGKGVGKAFAKGTKKLMKQGKAASTRRSILPSNVKASNFVNASGNPIFPPKHISSLPAGFKSPGLIVEINFTSLNKTVSFSPFITTIIGKDTKSRFTVGQFVGPGEGGRGLVAYEVYGAGPEDVAATVEVFRAWNDKNNSSSGEFYKASSEIGKELEGYIEMLESKLLVLRGKLGELVDKEYEDGERLINVLESAKAKAVEDLAEVLESQKEMT